MQVSQVLMSSDEDVNDCLLHVLCLQGLLGLVWFLSFSLTWGFSELAEGVVNYAVWSAVQRNVQVDFLGVKFRKLEFKWMGKKPTKTFIRTIYVKQSPQTCFKFP